MQYPNYESSYRELLTMQDAIDRVLVQNGCRTRHPGELSSARMAVMDAVRQIPGVFSWNYYRRAFSITTVGPAYNLNASYTHTGGDVERQLRLTSGTWPANAADCRVLLLNSLFDVQERVDSTTLQLTSDSNPGRDLAAQDVTLCQTDYRLGARIRRVLGLLESQTDLPIDYLSHPQLLRYLHINPTPSTPVFFNIHQSGKELNSIEITFAPPPLDARTYSLAVEMQPRPVRYYEELFTVSSVGSTVTAISGTFAEDQVGSVIRFSRDSFPVNGIGGDGAAYIPYVSQRIIKSVVSTTQATLDSPLPANVTDVSAVVTDPIDIDNNTMQGLFMAMCNRMFSQYSPNSPRLSDYLALEMQEKRAAIASNDYVHTDLLTKSGLTGMPEMDFILSFPITEG